MIDGDMAFLRVDNRRPPHALEPGVVAGAVNCRFDQGKPRPRLGVAQSSWGVPKANYDTWFPVWGYEGQLTALNDDRTDVQLDVDYGWPDGTTIRVRGTDTGGLDPDTDYYYGKLEPTCPGILWVWEKKEDAVALNTANRLEVNTYGGTTFIKAVSGIKTLGYARFNDPTTDSDNGILVTDDWRNGAGEDGGRGRAWRINPGNAPEEISLNGHDVWDECQLVQCHNAILLLRDGPQRYYFTAADCADAGKELITLHATPWWAPSTARRVRFEPAVADSVIQGTLAPAAGNYYYAMREATGKKITLYQDEACTTAMDYTLSVVGTFYLEVVENPTPFFGNVCRNLILQPSPTGNTPFDEGFQQVETDVLVTNTVATAPGVVSYATAPNHRFVPGDLVSFTFGTLPTPPAVYAAPQSEHTVRLYTTAADALADDGTTGIIDLGTGDSGTIWKDGGGTMLLSAMPLPGCRAGCYFKGRFVGVNGRDNLMISDPHDFLHGLLFSGQVTANLGESGKVTWLLPLGEDVLLVGKERCILAISGLDQASNYWRMNDVTSEYGGIAPRAALNVGTDVWCLSRKGVASVVRTVAGERLGVVRPVSTSIPEYMQLVDWVHASQSAFAVFNNRFFAATPSKAQASVVNDQIFVYNFLNQFLQVRQDPVRLNPSTDGGELVGGVYETESALDSWEGVWEGALLTPFAFAVVNCYGEESLTWASPDGTRRTVGGWYKPRPHSTGPRRRRQHRRVP